MVSFHFSCWASAVLEALRSPDVDYGVVAAGLGAIACLSSGQVANRVQLGELGACEGAMRLSNRLRINN